MKLIGMLDSPFVRRVAITMSYYQLPCVHLPLSVFRDFNEFKTLSPMVKAPTLVLDNGVRLVDSSLIIEYLDSINESENSLKPKGADPLMRCLEYLGLALVANEKSVQIMYEKTMRTEAQLNDDWLNRIVSQLETTYQQLEEKILTSAGSLAGNSMTHADIAVAVAWGFSRLVVPDIAAVERFPNIARFAGKMESLDMFKQRPIVHE